MSENGDLDIKKVIERGTERTTLKDLQQRGFESVKVLHENAVQEMISQAVDRVVTTQTAEERSRILAESRKELDRLLKEQRAIRSRAQLLESDKHELIEQVENLQREIQLKGELEEETLHRRLEQGLASLQSQVEDLRGRAQAAAQEADEARGTREKAVIQVAELQKEIERLTADRDRVEREAEENLARLGRLEKELGEEQSRSRGAEKARTDLVAQILDLQSKAGAAEAEVARLRAEHGALETLRATSEQERGATQEEMDRLRKELEASRRETAFMRGQTEELERLREKAAAAEEALHSLRSQAEAQREKTVIVAAELQTVEEREKAARKELEASRREVSFLKAQHDAARLEIERKGKADGEELERLQEELEGARQEVAFLKGQIAQQQKDTEAQRERTVIVTAELQEIEEKEKAEREELERLRTAEAELRARLSSSDGQREAQRAELEGARQEVAFLKGQIAQQQKDAEAEREKTVIVTAELQEIEERQRAEGQELDRLRADAARFAEENGRLRQDLETGRGEIEALQDLLRRQQEAARTAQNEAVSLQARHQEVLARSADAERERDRLRADREAVKLADLLERARLSSAAARASATRSREVAAELERTLARQLRPRPRPRGGSIRNGAAFDGMALLDDFFRKIRLKERFQRYLPVREQPGRPHPSESMAEVIKSIVAGDGRGAEPPKSLPLEIVGPSVTPGAEGLRQFLGGLSTKAIQSLGRVHQALRLHLSPLPRKPQPLVLDVAPLELGLGKRNRRTYQPLVCFDAAAGEFWGGQFRSNHVPAAEGILPFLQACLARVPAPFARSRIRVRMDARFFNEAVVRFLDAKGVSYVVQAPDTAAVRKGARRCAFTRLANGWEVGEFRQRLHPIRRTQGRFLVVRRRLSKKAKEAGPGLFRDERHVYHVFATDRRATPWRSFELYQARPASLEKARGLLSEFTTSPLLGRSRRSVAALFQSHLLASDLVQAFRRSCLPAEEKAHGLDELRGDFLMSPSRNGRRLVVLPRRDRRRRLFSRVARLTRRLKPARPFKLRP